jgi:hypothetical protein
MTGRPHSTAIQLADAALYDDPHAIHSTVDHPPRVSRFDVEEELNGITGR